MLRKPSARSRKTSSSKKERGDAPKLTVIKPILDNFDEALDSRTYRLRKRSKLFDGHVSLNVDKFVKRLQSQLKETELDEADPI